MFTNTDLAKTKMIDRPARQRLSQNLTAVTLGGLLAIMAGLYVYQASAFNTVRNASSNYLLASLKGREGTAREPLTLPPADSLAVALKSQPLSPVAVNAAIFAEAAHGAGAQPSARNMELLGDLGWRNTTALQNRIVYAVERQDVDQIVSIADALLRREELVREGHALMQLAEQAPPTRDQLAATLARNPSWRLEYFHSAVPLKGQQAIAARARLAKSLDERGAPLMRSELFATLPLLVDNGFAREAYDIWMRYRNQRRPALINDPQLRWAYQMRNDTLVGMPFEWQLPTGSGFWSEIVPDGANVALNISWDRQGVPVFLSQQLYIKPRTERLTLLVRGKNIPVNVMDNLAFTMVCSQAVVSFDKIVDTSATSLLLAASDPLGCQAPEFRVAGRPARFGSPTGPARSMGSDEAFSVTFTGLTITNRNTTG